MHIVLAILGAVGAISVLLWRLSLMGRAARDIVDAAEGLANLPRKMRFQSKTRRSGVQVITDPREAATVLMLNVARAGGEVTSQQKALIREQMARRFELSEDAADEMLTQVAWLSKDLPDPGSPVGRMTDLLRNSVAEKELIELEDMMAAVARVEGEPNDRQLDIIARYRRASMTEPR